MGAIMEHITLAELAETSGGKYDTIYRKARRKFPEMEWSANSILSAEHIAVLSGKVSAKRSAPRKAAPVKDFIRTTETISVNQPAPDVEATPPAPGRAKFEWPTWPQIRRWIFEALAIAIVCGHGFLLWQESAELYGYIGDTCGALIFAVVCLALLIAADSSRNRTSGFAVWFMLFVDAAAGFVHYEALHTPVVPNSMTVGFCVFICACSFTALYLFRDSKLD